MKDSKMEERLRKAEEYDERYPELCWAELVMWAFGGKKDDPLEEREVFMQTCTEESWYCGKCILTGRLKVEDVEVRNGKIFFKHDAK